MKIWNKIIELEEQISSLELRNINSVGATVENIPLKNSFLAECAMVQITALQNITPMRLEKFFLSPKGPKGNQTPRPSSLEVLNKEKLKGMMSVHFFKSQGVDTRALGSRCGDLQGMICNMETGLEFDAVTDDKDVMCLGTQAPHMATSPLVKD